MGPGLGSILENQKNTHHATILRGQLRDREGRVVDVWLCHVCCDLFSCPLTRVTAVLGQAEKGEDQRALTLTRQSIGYWVMSCRSVKINVSTTVVLLLRLTLFCDLLFIVYN